MKQLTRRTNKNPAPYSKQARQISLLKKEIKTIKAAIRVLDGQVAKLVDWAEGVEFEGQDDDEGGEEG